MIKRAAVRKQPLPNRQSAERRVQLVAPSPDWKWCVKTHPPLSTCAFTRFVEYAIGGNMTNLAAVGCAPRFLGATHGFAQAIQIDVACNAPQNSSQLARCPAVDDFPFPRR